MNPMQRLALATLTCAFIVAVTTPCPAEVVVNSSTLSAEVLQTLEEQFQIRIQEGRYWYDPMCGAWGLEGGHTLGFTLPGYPLGGELRTEASGGSGAGTLTGVFVNGRELHPTDLINLRQLMAVGPGRYWIDHAGNAGREGGPALVNLWRIAEAQARGGGSYLRRASGGYIGSDGTTSYFFDPETSASVMN